MKYIFMLLMLACTSTKTINLKKHTFNEVPKNIIWFQIAGLAPEHLALIRFKELGDHPNDFENATCLGNMWTFNSYKLRPTPAESFLTQMTGKTNIKNTCEDFLNKPLWYYLKDRGFKTGIIEIGAASDESLFKANHCPKENEFKKITLFSMGNEKKENFKKLDLLDSSSFQEGAKYHISCEVCEQNILPSVTSIFNRFGADKNFNLFIIRDFSFKNYLKKGDYQNAKYFLEELSKTYSVLLEKKETLILLTSSGMAKVDFPASGKPWMEFEKEGKNAPYKNDSLLSFALAQGPGSEKFCGIYSESDILERILIDPTKKFKKFLFW